MRILEKAGIPPATDKVRKPNQDNPRGYFEIDNIVDRLGQDPNMVFGFGGRALKVIHYGLKILPECDYKILYVERDLDEVMASMERMAGIADPDRAGTKKAFERLAKKVKAHIDSRKDMKVLYISHRSLVTDPGPEIDGIIEFLKIDPQKRGEMIDAIDPAL